MSSTDILGKSDQMNQSNRIHLTYFIIYSQLREAAPHHAFLQELDLKSNAFDQAAAKFALVDSS